LNGATVSGVTHQKKEKEKEYALIEELPKGKRSIEREHNTTSKCRYV